MVSCAHLYLICFRLIKGDGEVLEEIVSKQRHQEINRQATQGDGTSFQSGLTAKLMQNSNNKSFF